MSKITTAIVRWQKKQGRHNLPWQKDNNPYHIWLSEIMLQQTQVTTVIDYYQHFLKKFPTIDKLANAKLDSVLAAWSGLGYYARARHLHQTAKYIIAHGIPQTAVEWQALPGIGKSTAAAIMVFAYNQPHAILDGNVKRILARVFLLPYCLQTTAAQNLLWKQSTSLIPSKRSIRQYTQGLMDLGATICHRQNPRCNHCPITSYCMAYQNKTTDSYPIKTNKKKKPTQTATFTWLRWKNATLLFRRPTQGIWGGLWALPQTQKQKAKIYWEQFIGAQLVCQPKQYFNHSFTHYHLKATVVVFDCANTPTVNSSGYRWTTNKQLSKLGIPTPLRVIITHSCL